MRTKNLFPLLLCSALFTTVMLSCTNEDNTATGSDDTVAEEIHLTPALESAYNVGVNDLAFATFRAMADANPGTSLVYSPVSASSLLAMLCNGAGGDTLDELLQALGFGQEGMTALNEYYCQLMADAPAADPTVSLHLANGVFTDDGSTVKPAFAADMENYYHAQAASLDFAAPTTLDYINGWCSQQTDGLIPSFLDELDPTASCLLLNAVGFKGKWATPFISSYTLERPFTREDGTVTTVKRMFMDMGEGNKCPYTETDDYQAVRMAYGQGRYAMTVVLPRKGVATTDGVIAALSGEAWNTLCSSLSLLSGSELVISLPRFTVATPSRAENLEPVLQQVGAGRMFTPQAEFPGILEDGGLQVSKVCQKAVINVTEEGTEAAAVTGGFIISDDPGETQYTYFTCDHPFIYIISDVTTGVIYFIGTYHG